MESQNDLITFSPERSPPKLAKIRPLLGKTTNLTMEPSRRGSSTFAELASLMRTTPAPFPSYTPPSKPLNGRSTATKVEDSVSPSRSSKGERQKLVNIISASKQLPNGESLTATPLTMMPASPMSTIRGTFDPKPINGCALLPKSHNGLGEETTNSPPPLPGLLESNHELNIFVPSGRLTQDDIDRLEEELTRHPVADTATSNEETERRLDQLAKQNGVLEDIKVGKKNGKGDLGPERTNILHIRGLGIPPPEKARNISHSMVQMSLDSYNTILQDRDEIASEVRRKDQIIQKLLSSIATVQPSVHKERLSPEPGFAKLLADRDEEIADLRKKMMTEVKKREEEAQNAEDLNAVLAKSLEEALQLSALRKNEIVAKEMEAVRLKERVKETEVETNTMRQKVERAEEMVMERSTKVKLEDERSANAEETDMQKKRAAKETKIEAEIAKLREALATEKFNTHMLADQRQDMDKARAHMAKLQENLTARIAETSRLRNDLHETNKILENKEAIVRRFSEGSESQLRGAAHLVHPSPRTKLPRGAFACIECYSKNQPCDTKKAHCENCLSANIKCKRFRCSKVQILKGECPDNVFCPLRHNKDGWLITEQERPEW